MPKGSGVKYRRIRWLVGIMVLVAVAALSVRMAGQPRGGVVKESGVAYGEYIGWEEADKIFLRRGKACITDVDTGRSFYVVRLGGSLHADVEPFSAVDTAEMKSIMGGAWSWKRRAALLTVEGRTLACSINGMPHGPGRIGNNNFPGHFCVHFKDSRLHVTRREDPAHSLMVIKAAGLVDELLAECGPEKVVRIFFTALDQGDLGILARATRFESPAQLAELLGGAGFVERVGLYRTALKGDAVEVSLGVQFKNDPRSYEKKGLVKVNHHGFLGWRVEYSSVKPLLVTGGQVLPGMVIKEDDEEKLDI
jgi:hypothetical protein